LIDLVAGTIDAEKSTPLLRNLEKAKKKEKKKEEEEEDTHNAIGRAKMKC
jgi:hypothetical protein